MQFSFFCHSNTVYGRITIKCKREMHMFDRNIYTYIYIYICVFTEQLFSWGVVLARLDCQGLSLFGCIHGEFWKHHGESSVSGHSSVRHPGKLPIFTLILSLTISRMECYCLDAMDSLQTTVSKPIATSVVYLINILYIYINQRSPVLYTWPVWITINGTISQINQ